MAIQLITERNGTEGAVYDFRCPYPTGCGMGGVPFSSTGWSDRDHAVARGKQHIQEHQTADDPDAETVPMQDLHEFRVERGLTESTAGQAVNPDDWTF